MLSSKPFDWFQEGPRAKSNEFNMVRGVRIRFMSPTTTNVHLFTHTCDCQSPNFLTGFSDSSPPIPTGFLNHSDRILPGKNVRQIEADIAGYDAPKTPNTYRVKCRANSPAGQAIRVGIPTQIFYDLHRHPMKLAVALFLPG